MTKKNILVVGGAGYIGSHMTAALVRTGYQPVVLDNLSTGHREMVPQEAHFIEGELSDAVLLKRIFSDKPIDAVIHMAASSIVPESVKNPLKYYRNNVAACIPLLEEMTAAGVSKLIFSSTAAVYGNPEETPLTENSRTQPINPYGWSKWMIEQMIRDTAVAHELSFVVLRYFNAAGAHDSGCRGEKHHPETHLIPNLLASMNGSGQTLTLFGDDYETKDGTCVRDYIHVEDLCAAHILALEYLQSGGRSEIFNLGTEEGFSVGEVIEKAQAVTGKPPRVTIGPRRPGDPPVLVASSKKAREILKWKPQHPLTSILESAWRWYEHEHVK